MFDMHFAIRAFPEILSAAPMTLFLSVISTLIGILFAALIAFLRIKKIPVLNELSVVFVSMIRGTPILVQLFVVYYGLPEFLSYLQTKGFALSANGLPHLLIAIIAFTFNASAYLSEVFRSAYRSVDSGQMEAALSVGMNGFQALIRIIIPQALTAAIPNFSNVFIELLKDTSLAYNIEVVELMAKSNVVAALGLNYLEAYVDALIIYLVICFLFSQFFHLLELRFKKYTTI